MKPSAGSTGTKPSGPAGADARAASAPATAAASTTAAGSSAATTPVAVTTVAAASPSKVATPTSELAKYASKVRFTDDGKQVPIGNGGVGPNYWWTQTLAEASVYFDLPAGTSPKSVAWTVTTKTLRLAVAGEVLLEGALGGTVRPSECLWEIEVRPKAPQCSLQRTR